MINLFPYSQLPHLLLTKIDMVKANRKCCMATQQTFSKYISFCIINILKVRLCVCVFWQGKMYTPTKVGHVLLVLHSLLRPIGIGRAICPGLLSILPKGI